MLKNHFTLYQGYVANTNKVLDILGLMAKDGKTATPEYAELKRRLGWEFNGMRLHELYFGNLGGKAPIDPASKIGRKIAEQFADIESWEKDFRATGAMRGIGWVVLYLDNDNGRLINFWIELIGIPSFVSTHLVRHKFGVEHFVESNRDDRGGAGDESVNRLTPVNHGMFVNAQALIAMSRKRLCYASHIRTVAVWSRLRKAMKKVCPDMAEALVPECVYRGSFCPELRECKPGLEKVVAIYRKEQA
jgi:hypothetical protein